MIDGASEGSVLQFALTCVFFLCTLLLLLLFLLLLLSSVLSMLSLDPVHKFTLFT
jgi:hypothetical protein